MNNISHEMVLVFLCYKQAQYLPKTLPSAINQTLKPGELLILDDASPDDSDEVIKKILAEENARASSEGDKARIVYDRNTENIGLMAQLNSLASRYNNKLIVIQAGDDLSKPNRLERIYAHWVKQGKPSLVLSNFDEIDEAGRIVRQFDPQKMKTQKKYSFDRLLRRRSGVFGCTAAIDSQLLKAFPPIPSEVVNEDRITSFRALLKNGIHYIHEPLIDYRVGVGISARTEHNYIDYLKREAQRELVDLSVNRKDAIQENRTDLVRRIDRRARVIEWLASLNEPPRLSGIFGYWRSGVPVIDALKLIKKIRKRSR